MKEYDDDDDDSRKAPIVFLVSRFFKSLVITAPIYDLYDHKNDLQAPNAAMFRAGR